MCSLISIVGFLDSIVAAKQNAARFGYSISPNRELVALGAANLMGSFIPGTLPAYGSITRYVPSQVTFVSLITAVGLVSMVMLEDAHRWHLLYVLVLCYWRRSSSCLGYTSFRNVSWLRCKSYISS